MRKPPDDAPESGDFSGGTGLEASPTVHNPYEARGGSLGNVDVLVVEDDGDLRRVVAETLTEWGLSVAWASHGAEALSLVAEGLRPRAVLLDLEMPVLNGWEFLRVRDAQPALTGVPIVVLTGSDERPAALGVADHIVKPVSADSLVAVLTRVMQQRRRAVAA